MKTINKQVQSQASFNFDQRAIADFNSSELAQLAHDYLSLSANGKGASFGAIAVGLGISYRTDSRVYKLLFAVLRKMGADGRLDMFRSAVGNRTIYMFNGSYNAKSIHYSAT